LFRSKDVLETHSNGTILNSKSPRNYSHNVPFCSTKISSQNPNAAKVLEIVVNQVWEYVSWLPIDAEKGENIWGFFSSIFFKLHPFIGERKTKKL